MAITAAIAAGGLAIGSTVMQMKNSNDAKNASEQAAQAQAQQSKQLQDQMTQKEQENQAQGISEAQKEAATARSRLASGYGGTILTGGFQGTGSGASASGASTGGKTLLGM